MRAGPLEQAVDARWLMAYSAALGETDFPHALFPVCYEWPATQALRASSGLQRFNAQLVHAQHDLVIHRKPAAEALATDAQIVSARQRRPGAFVVLRLSARDARGEPVSTSDYGMLYRGVELEGPERSIEPMEDPPEHSMVLKRIGDIPISATAAHVYTECARIWNPIHTDTAYARAAGLPGIILHGTATLALSISKVLNKFQITPDSVRRVRCRFSGMVLMPSTLAVAGMLREKSIQFETRNASGEAVIGRGQIDLLH